MNAFHLIKHIGIYMLLCIYSYILLRPSLPLAKDFVAHAFYEWEHVAKVHFENGKFHVHVEMEDQAKQQKHQPEENNSNLSGVKIDSHYLNSSIELENKQKQHAVLYSTKISTEISAFCKEIYLSATYPPPQL